MERSTITVTKGGAQSFVGKEAVDYFRAATCLSALKLFKLGVTPGRGVKRGVVMQIAGQYTGNVYKRNEIETAIKDMEAYLKAEKARWVPEGSEA